MARGDAPVRSSMRPAGWSVFLIAMAGAWLGHFVEYVRVSGWHAGLADMTASDHAYFMPAGAALVAAGLGASFLLRRVWLSLERRLRHADIILRKPPAKASGSLWGPVTDRPVGVVEGRDLARLWVMLALLQSAIWVAQENVEAWAGGRRPPLWGVVSGAHVLAPVVQAEIALILAIVYVGVYLLFRRRLAQVRALECLVARRWHRHLLLTRRVPPAPTFADTPLERWGSQRWQRPPPLVWAA